MPKRVHAFLRKQLLDHTEHSFLKTALGGLPHKSTDYATLLVTAFLQTGEHTRTPQSLLFIDLAAAFYTIIMELCIRTNTSPDALKDSLRKKITDEQTQQILVNLQQQQDSELDDVPQTLNVLLAEFYYKTNYTSPITQDTFHTTLGTRAGMPLADLFFNYTINQALTELDNQINNNGLIKPFLHTDNPSLPLHSSHGLMTLS